MGHHASEMSDDARVLFDQIFKETGQPLGATGQFPMGKIAPSDEGELRMAVGHEAGKVVVAFGKPIAWIGFDKQQALALANSIIEHAAQLK